mmetsp:Transcript_31238/g.89566  ORF Transcript_31238/g.89566 Transcript_31238/m.89566 type:complete len:233 (-) Transcript_31238:1555-2253(-)
MDICGHTDVLQRATGDHVHPGAGRALAGPEEYVAARHAQHGHGRVADLPHDLRTLLHVMREKRMAPEHTRVHGEVKVDEKRLGDELQNCNLVFRHEPLLLLNCLLCAPLETHRQALGDVVLRQVLSKHRDELGVAAGDEHQPRHRGCQAAHENGGQHEGHQEGGDGKGALLKVLGHNLVHASGVLRHRPVKGKSVPIAQSPLMQTVGLDPREAILSFAATLIPVAPFAHAIP